MQLIYRGLSYEPTSQPVELAQVGTVCRFRGLTYTVGTVASTPSVANPVSLRYRGLSY